MTRTIHSPDTVDGHGVSEAGVGGCIVAVVFWGSGGRDAG